LNVLVSFAGDMAQPVNTIEYVPPSDSSIVAATQLDVMVLPEGQMDITGRPIQSFTCRQHPASNPLHCPIMQWVKAYGSASQVPPMPKALRSVISGF
jgi:hypothetical protein